MVNKSQPEQEKDTSTKTIVKIMSQIIILCISGSIILTLTGKTTPDLVNTLGTGSFGTLTGMLISPNKKNGKDC